MNYFVALGAGFLALASLSHPASGQLQPGHAGRPAAAPKVNPLKSEPMKVRIVRSAEPGCEPACAEWISAQGQIDSSTPGEFRRALARLGSRKLPILIDSVGGSVDPSMAVGRMIRAKGLDVVVNKTTLAPPCDANDVECRKLKAQGIERGRPEAKISKCASSCAFILAGGVRRYVGAWTVVGLHEIKSISTRRLVRQHYRIVPASPWTGAPPRKQVLKEEVLRVETREGPAEEKTYEKIRAYFAEMGIGEAIMPILREAPNSSIRWVRIAELKSTGLATDFLNGEQLLAPPPAATASIAVPSPGVVAPCGPASTGNVPCTTGSVAPAAPAAGPAITAPAPAAPPAGSAAAATARAAPPTRAPAPSPKDAASAGTTATAAQPVATGAQDARPKQPPKPKPRPPRAKDGAEPPFSFFQN